MFEVHDFVVFFFFFWFNLQNSIYIVVLFYFSLALVMVWPVMSSLEVPFAIIVINICRIQSRVLMFILEPVMSKTLNLVFVNSWYAWDPPRESCLWGSLVFVFFSAFNFNPRFKKISHVTYLGY